MIVDSWRYNSSCSCFLGWEELRDLKVNKLDPPSLLFSVYSSLQGEQKLYPVDLFRSSQQATTAKQTLFNPIYRGQGFRLCICSCRQDKFGHLLLIRKT